MKKLILKDKEILSVGFFGLGKSNVGVMNYLAAHYPHLKFTLRQDNPIYADGAQLTRKFNRIFIGKSSLDEHKNMFYEEGKQYILDASLSRLQFILFTLNAQHRILIGNAPCLDDYT